MKPDEGNRIEALIDEGMEIFERFDHEVRTHRWHPFVPSNYESVHRALRVIRSPGKTFLEWGSGTGVITIMADLLGFEATGIELDAELVETARSLATRFDSRARFVAGSFIPAGYRPKAKRGDGRLGTIGEGPSAYAELGHGLDDFDVVYACPWTGEEAVMLDVLRQYGNRAGEWLLHGDEGIAIYHQGHFLRRV